ncbi:hypothetical protein [Paenibacillus larvae]|uniref:hypothetical protein n=1 Tax=Paenibacillus larvae TaxID=1464 RepID=UPI00288FB170|nr:hypothetical protein [Paenibacillus larvae]MDT2191791.1 hypothetical protein [Paenibacillus larvae]MDT2238228.1 hypothetical protein [Paenibacillus larvae]MDT2242356.1 hypothetical protein [Paenibacillus larvae]MDT2248144.1 hypothetical protein [Paenibacillus larvae]MDT2257569.1 hypothetical protein [Paenibacillus larvae]
MRKRDRKHPLHLIFPRLADICLFKKRKAEGRLARMEQVAGSISTAIQYSFT